MKLMSNLACKSVVCVRFTLFVLLIYSISGCDSKNPCDPNPCAVGLICASDGSCVEPSCLSIRCAPGLICRAGSCFDPYKGQCNNDPPVTFCDSKVTEIGRQFFYRQDKCQGCPWFGEPASPPGSGLPLQDLDSHLNGATQSVGPDGAGWKKTNFTETFYFPSVARFDGNEWVCYSTGNGTLSVSLADRINGTLATNTRTCGVIP